MTSPAKLLSPLASIWPGWEKTVNKAFGVDGNAPAAPDIPAPPPLAPPATQPTSKPAKKGQQQSFLSGVAASALGGTSSRSSAGKSLLGQ